MQRRKHPFKRRKKPVFRKRWLIPLLLLVLSVAQYYEQGNVSWHQSALATVRHYSATATAMWDAAVREQARPAPETESSGQVANAEVSVSGQAAEMETELSGRLAEAELETVAQAENTAVELSGRVMKVTDGDTFTLRTSGRREHIIRLQGIDAPERQQAHGSAASRALSRLVDGEQVTVLVDETDDYGRLVGTVYLGGEDINLAMVRGGHAWWYQYYAQSNRALAKAEAEARQARMGLWAAGNPMPPWDWRRAH